MWNSGTTNTGVGFTTDSSAANSGFGNIGIHSSGFFNTASGPSIGGISGFFNHASGSESGLESGFFNTGAPSPSSSGVNGDNSGLLNTGSQLSGLLNIGNLLG